jgi:hypothetical protein
MAYYILFGLPLVALVYLFVKFSFDLLLRGFSPFIPSRPWVVEQIMGELEIKKKQPVFLALSSGRSGFFRALGEKYKDATLIGVEPYFFSYLVAKVQNFMRGNRMKIIHQPIHHVDYSKADFIYCHLYPDQMKELGPKLKFECKNGAKIVSTGFSIAHLRSVNVIDLPDRKGRLDWLSKNQRLFQSKKKKYKKEKKAFFYEI